MPELIELASLLAAILLGVPLIFLTESAAVSVFVWLFGVLAGVAGSRLASLIRRRESVAEIRRWAKTLYAEH